MATTASMRPHVTSNGLSMNSSQCLRALRPQNAAAINSLCTRFLRFFPVFAGACSNPAVSLNLRLMASQGANAAAILLVKRWSACHRICGRCI
jgi:hypothetical protein